MASAQRSGGDPRSSAIVDVIRGRRFGRPTHPIFVVFPIAFFAGTLVIDALSLMGLAGAARSGTLVLVLGLVGAAVAIPTGLLDRSVMRRGSRIHRVATRHMLLQLSGTAVFVVDLAIRLGERHREHASPVWLILDAIGLLIILVGGDAGGQMVFRMGYRVGERTDRPEPQDATGETAGPPS